MSSHQDCPQAVRPALSQAQPSLQQRFRDVEVGVQAAPDWQISPTGPGAPSMSSSGKATGIVGHNVRIAIDCSTIWPSRRKSPTTAATAAWAPVGRQAQEANWQGGITVLQTAASTRATIFKTALKLTSCPPWQSSSPEVKASWRPGRNESPACRSDHDVGLQAYRRGRQGAAV